MDIFTLLKEDHRKVKKVLKELVKECGEEEINRAKIEECISDIELHAKIEEKYLYPRAEEIKEASNLVTDAYEEHDEVKELVKKVEEHMEEASELAKYFEMILIGIEHHVEEEEGELFPLMKEKLEQSVIDTMTEKAVAMKEKGMARK